MSDLNIAMIVRLMDQFSQPSKKLHGHMRDLGRGYAHLRDGFSKSIKSGFSTANLEAAMQRSEARISRAQGRLQGALAMAVTLGAPVMVAGNLEERMIDFANLAEIDAERVAELRLQLAAMRKETGQTELQLLTGLESFVGKGMGLDEALEALPATGRAAKATKSQFDEMANSGFSLMDNLNVMPDRLRKAFDIMALTGKEGSFELKAMASWFPQVTAGAKALGMEGETAVASLAAALQVAMKSAGSEDQAANNMVNFMGKLTAPDTVKKFAKFGVNVEKELRIALERGTDPLEHMLMVIEEMTGGDAFKMGELFADKQVLDFLRAAIPNLEEYQRIRDKALSADGVIDKDFERVLTGFNESMRQLWSSVTGLLGASGSLLPVLTDIVQQVTVAVDYVAAWTQANPELTETLVKGAAALLAFGIGTRVLGLGFAVMQGGLIRTVGLFLKFNKAGKNVSLVARAYRALSWSARGAGRAMWALMTLGSRLPGAGWARRLKPLKWSSLIKPLKWTPKLIPAIGWALAGKLKWTSLIKPLTWLAKGALRFIHPIGWAVLAGELLWHALIKPLGWDKYITLENAKKQWLRLKDVLTWDNVIDTVQWALFLPPRALIAAWKNLRGLLNWSDILPSISSLFSGETQRAAGQRFTDEETVFQQFVAPHTSEAEMRRQGALTAAPQDYRAKQPDVTVESSFESHPTINVDVQMPVTIKREQRLDSAKIARDAGARVERKVRAGLDDAAIAEGVQ